MPPRNAPVLAALSVVVAPLQPARDVLMSIAHIRTAKRFTPVVVVPVARIEVIFMIALLIVWAAGSPRP